jgi:hypothetical protein
VGTKILQSSQPGVASPPAYENTAPVPAPPAAGDVEASLGYATQEGVATSWQPGGGGGVTIGQPVAGGTASSLLATDASDNLAVGPPTASVVSASGATDLYVPIADGSNGYTWGPQSGGSYVGPGSDAFLLSAYGAVGDGKIVLDGAITATQDTLASTSAAFTTADVGKHILVTGAGAAGAHLATTISSVSGGVATLAVAAGTTVTGAWCAYGTDDTAAFISAINAAWNAGGGVVYGGTATYIIAGALQTAATAGDNTAGLAYCAQIPLPAVSYSQDKRTVVLAGAFPMDLFPSNSGPPTDAFQDVIGMRLVSLGVGGVDSGSAWPSVIGGPDFHQDDGHFSNLNFQLRDLQIVMPENPSYAACMLYRTLQGGAQGVSIRALTPVLVSTTVQPTSPTGQGLVMPGNFCDDPNKVSGYVALGLYAGIAVDEHTRFDNTIIHECYVAVSVVGQGGHLIAGDANTQHCAYMVAYADPVAGVSAAPISGGQGFIDISLDTEMVVGGSPSWEACTALVWADGLAGGINYHDGLRATYEFTPLVLGSGFPKIFDYSEPLWQFGAYAGLPALQNGFIDDSYSGNAGFYVDRSGVIHFVGGISASAGKSGVVLFTMPLPWRPASARALAADVFVDDTYAALAGRVNLLFLATGGTGGQMYMYGSVTAGQCISLDSIPPIVTGI